MGLKKETRIDQISIVGEFKKLNIKESTVISEGTNASGWTEISNSIHRSVLTPDTDVSSKSTEIQDVASLVWTDAIKASWDSYVESLDD